VMWRGQDEEEGLISSEGVAKDKVEDDVVV
jgi:hypothetical protein